MANQSSQSIACLQGLFLGFEADQEIPRHLKAEPVSGHAGSDLQQVRNEALVEPPDALLAHDECNGVSYRFILVAHAGHGVNLESSPQHVASTSGLACTPISTEAASTHKG